MQYFKKHYFIVSPNGNRKVTCELKRENTVLCDYFEKMGSCLFKFSNMVVTDSDFKDMFAECEDNYFDNLNSMAQFDTKRLMPNKHRYKAIKKYIHNTVPRNYEAEIWTSDVLEKISKTLKEELFDDVSRKYVTDMAKCFQAHSGQRVTDDRIWESCEAKLDDLLKNAIEEDVRKGLCMHFMHNFRVFDACAWK